MVTVVVTHYFLSHFKAWLGEVKNTWIYFSGFSCSRLFFFFLFFLRFIYYYISVHCSCLQTHEKRASDLITDGCEPPCCWDLNSGPSKSSQCSYPLSHFSNTQFINLLCTLFCLRMCHCARRGHQTSL